MLEYESGTILVYGVGPSVLLAILVCDPADLGNDPSCAQGA